jgi:putative peptidoglycan lipid II flippase
MTLALVPALRSVGLTWPLGARTPDLGHPGLRQAARLAGWGLVYVIISQLGFLVVTNLSVAKGVVGLSTYTNAYQLFQLPYAIVGVSVVTALLPTLAGHHAAQRQDLARRDLARALRLAGALVIPGAVLLVALSGPIAVLTFAHGRTSPHQAALIGDVLALLAVGLVPFTIQQSLLRALYAEGDSKTAALLGGLTTGVLVAVDLVIAHEQTGPDRVVGLAGGFAVAWTIGALVTIRVLRRRMGGDGQETYLTVRLGVRALVASLLGAIVVVALRSGVSAVLTGHGSGHGLLVATAQLVVAGTAAGVVTIRAMKRMQIHELDPLLRRIPGAAVVLGSSGRLNPTPLRADIH